MAIPTTRDKSAAVIHIDQARCTGCGLCVSVCKDFGLEIRDAKVALSGRAFFGCVGCGHCMAICPTGAITIQGRTLTPADLIDLPAPDAAASYGQLYATLLRRRSIREFLPAPVERPLVDKILEAAQTAPAGLPPSDVHVAVWDSREKVRAFTQDFCSHLEGMKWFFSNWFLTLMRPFWGKTNDEVFRGFVQPAYRVFVDNMRRGVNLVTYDAPLAMYFYGSPYSDPADPIIAATYAMIAAETLGLGTCMLGSIHPLIQFGGKARRFRATHGIRHASREGLFVIFGHPAVQYRKCLRRTFAAIDDHD